MRTSYLLSILCLQNALQIYAQGKGRPRVDADPYEPGVEKALPPKDAAKAPVPGALAVGAKQYPATVPANEEENSEVIEHLADLFKDLVELADKLKDLISYSTSTSTYTEGQPPYVTSTFTLEAYPASASPCLDASNFYDICSSTFSQFTTLAATSQAGCLCNAYQSADFNSAAGLCYSFVSTESDYEGFTTALANGTALCDITRAAAAATTVSGARITSSSPVTAAAPPTSTPTSGAGCGVEWNGGSAAFLFHVLSVMICLST